ncbi:serine hydrolase domain-containing protein [Mycolicibacterium helvum]|nr:serine hydrolase domain-containing protein [Mycolicibacterium helvum]
MSRPLQALTTALVVSTAAVLSAGCATNSDSPADQSTAFAARRNAAVQSEINKIVKSGVAGMLATLTADGHTTTLTSGVANHDTSESISVNSRFRIGSITKSFTAAILMQLVSEARLNLDDTIEKHLPGMLSGEGVDGRTITVRQILQHRSGLPEFAGDPRTDELKAAAEHRTVTPSEALAVALGYPAQSRPGAEYKYTNTNYLIAGILIEKITGNSYADELNNRLLRPHSLNDTYLPPPGELGIRGPHPHGYEKDNGVVVDVSRIEPSVPWAAGAIVSTGADLNRFFLDLLNGKVVAPAQLAEMEQFIPNGDGGPGYGIGLEATALPCGARLIGHSGGIPGYYTISGATAQGRAATITFTQAPDAQPDIAALLTYALCDQ